MEGGRSRWIVAGGNGDERRKTVEFMAGLEFVDGYCRMDNFFFKR